MWETFVNFMIWMYQTFENLVTVSIIIPTWFVAHFIRFFDWATYFVYRYYEFMASTYWIDIGYEAMLYYYYIGAVIALYFMLWPVTFPLTLFWLVFISWWW